MTFLRKTEVSFVCKVGNNLFCFLMKCKNFSTKSKYSILKYIYSLSFGYLKQHCCMGITLLTKEITPKNIFYRNEIQYRDDVPTKRKVGM